MEEEIFVDNRIIEDQITKKYHQVKKIMLTDLNNDYRYKSIELKTRESRIMLEILRFHPEFKKKWTKGCKFVYAENKNKKGEMYNDIFIKHLQGKLINFRKSKCIKGLQQLEKDFKIGYNNKKKEFEEQVNVRKELGICTKCFGYDTANKKFVFCDCLLVRTDYDKFACSNPLESHIVISGKLLKSVHATYEDGYEGEDPSDNQSIYDKYYITNENITIPDRPIIQKGDILYHLSDKKYILVGKEDNMDSFRQKLNYKIAEANENNTIIEIPKGYRNLKKYDK
ncbi:MAG: hypothetical protein CBB97_02520 [Candidatus Endolissoclinum sp. TMED37]|nr:MAG: hypothetical protein CBB97_02520 [Candidatus Endolissoclinum sp. TMED37]|tara:strand:- start:32 stop:880 length:849 start_codon:yes stop_codon:yes gene_type:complete